MINTLAIANYRSLLRLVLPLEQLTIITGANGTGKSNLYRALRLLADTARGGVIPSLAGEGGLDSTFWAGPENLSRRMRLGEVPVQGGPRKHTVRLRLGFNSDEFGYAIDLGLPPPTASAFSLDPEIKREVIWSGPCYRPASALVDRRGPIVRYRQGRKYHTVSEHVPVFESLFQHLADPVNAPEVFHLREYMNDWRFYDQFRTDRDAPARQPQLATRTPVLSHDGHDVAAAIQTIREIGDVTLLDEAVADAFPGATLTVQCSDDHRFRLQFSQPGLLRTLDGSELSDGTLRYLLWIAALLTPRPPALMVLNEPETSLHPDLLPALARLIVSASENSQIWIVSHARRLINALEESGAYHSLELEKELGQTLVQGQRELDEPSWHWPSRS
ncbi:MAG: AAA family ATPase [Gammaproteobacteria bacterium]|nr:AAA family ATPase [Gammaproteobacteria bacterium]